MLFKVSSFHAYTHQEVANSDDLENCAICELAIENQHSEFTLTTSETSIITFSDLQYRNEVVFCNAITPTSYLQVSFFGRPPPTSI